MKPNSIPSSPKENSYQAELFQNWHKNGQCPEGTVPIRRTQENESIPHRRTQLNHSFYDSSGHEVTSRDNKTRFFTYWTVELAMATKMKDASILNVLVSCK
uniref:Neprosin activation peptide domain-containing protein n=1 Tax=Quercus lobata TaxID=97700 RepID=A0A7N2LMP3_QUELO